MSTDSKKLFSFVSPWSCRSVHSGALAARWQLHTSALTPARRRPWCALHFASHTPSTAQP